MNRKFRNLPFHKKKYPPGKTTGYSEGKDLKIPLTPFSKGGTYVATP
jgi:hypothetical protein